MSWELIVMGEQGSLSRIFDDSSFLAYVSLYRCQCIKMLVPTRVWYVAELIINEVKVRVYVAHIL